jgi:hypothetical protein
MAISNSNVHSIPRSGPLLPGSMWMQDTQYLTLEHAINCFLIDRIGAPSSEDLGAVTKNADPFHASLVSSGLCSMAGSN